MNSPIPKSHNVRRRCLQTKFKRCKWYNEIEKRKAIQKDTYPQPRSIKHCLGECLGQRVIDTIPEHVLHEFTTRFGGGKLSPNFGVTIENLSSGNIKLTPVDTGDDAETNISTILRVGERLKSIVLPKFEDELDKEMESQLDKLNNEITNNLAEKIIDIREAEKDRYELECVAVVKKYQSMFVETIKSIEENIMNKAEIKQKNKLIRIEKKMEKFFISSAEKKEKVLRDTFNYHMQLARNELFEKFQNEKFKLAHQWEKELKILREKIETELEQLRKSLETEHAQDLIELEQLYEMKNRTISAKVDDKTEVENEADESVLLSTLQIKQIDDELRTKNRELLVYKKRLNYILNGYIDFIKNDLKKNTKLRKNQLNEAYNLLKYISKTEIEIINEYENPSCV